MPNTPDKPTKKSAPPKPATKKPPSPARLARKERRAAERQALEASLAPVPAEIVTGSAVDASLAQAQMETEEAAAILAPEPEPEAASEQVPAETEAQSPEALAEDESAAEVEGEEEEEKAPSPFAALGLSEPIARAISEMGFEAPTPIQERAIPLLLAGNDLIGQAQTGTGKTAAFALPMVQRIDPSRRETQALVLAPTRELAVQVAGGIHDLARHTGMRVVPIYGGQPIDRQFRALQAGAQVVVGTPGRVQDHLRRGSLSLEHVSFCVLDEADEMLALGFLEEIEAILSLLPTERQLAFFSATFPPRIVHLVKKYGREPQRVSIESKARTLETTNQAYYEVAPGKKLDALARVLDMETPGPTIVFCRTRQETNDLAEALRLRGHGAESLHGDMNQPERERVLRRFREGISDLLVATDVAARGLDIEAVTHVINYDIPWDAEQYIHRIGRTGRAGRSGDAITFVEGRERRQLKLIERAIGSPIKPVRLPTAADIDARRRESFKESLRETLRASTFDGHLAAVEELSSEFDPSEIAAAALQMLWQSQHVTTEQTNQEMQADGEHPEAGMTRLYVAMGRQDHLRPGDLVGAIAGEAGISGQSIGAIDILDRSSFVEVPSAQAENVIEALKRTRLKGRRVNVQIARPAGERN
jgi:ATP-dependent RNA helicase DeaD